jgi:hypothetical protein
MLQEYPITRTSRRCHIGQRPLESGERYYSMLVMQGETIVRVDTAAEHWKGPPENTLGWWRCRMPQASGRQLRPAPAGVLLDSLTELLKYPEQSALAYLLALLLMRRKILTEISNTSSAADYPDDHDQVAMFASSDGRQWQVPICLPSDSNQAHRLQESLVGLLFSEE